MLLRSNPIKNQKRKISFLPQKKRRIKNGNRHYECARYRRKSFSLIVVFKKYRISHGHFYFGVFPVRSSNLIICTCTMFPPFFANDISLSALTDGLSLLLLLLRPNKQRRFSLPPSSTNDCAYPMGDEHRGERESQQQLKGSHYRANKEL